MSKHIVLQKNSIIKLQHFSCKSHHKLFYIFASRKCRLLFGNTDSIFFIFACLRKDFLDKNREKMRKNDDFRQNISFCEKNRIENYSILLRNHTTNFFTSLHVENVGFYLKTPIVFFSSLQALGKKICQGLLSRERYRCDFYSTLLRHHSTKNLHLCMSKM